MRALGLDPDADELLARAVDEAREEVAQELPRTALLRRGTAAAMLARRHFLVRLATRLRDTRLAPALEAATSARLETLCAEVADALTFSRPGDPDVARGFDPLGFRFADRSAEGAAPGWIRLAFVVAFLPSQRAGLERAGLDEARAARRIASELRRRSSRRAVRANEREGRKGDERWNV